MPVAGAKPVEDRNEVRHRNPATHEWEEVVDTPYDGDRPSLPTQLTLMSRGGNTYKMQVLPEVVTWWQAISSMPHCVLWSDSDWQFALATAAIAQQAWLGNTGASAELRMREKIMGTTWDARRDLRIKYVAQLTGSNEEAAESNGAVVAPSNDRRSRLTSVA